MGTNNVEGRGSIEVRAFFSLALVVGMGGRADVSVPAPRATVAGVVGELGLAPEAVGLVMVNGCRADLETPVSAGDRIAFFPEYVPYHKAYGMCVL
ncbi:MAG: hypothetical protein FIA95_04280 [Gemmatimonadetes bacterium]|nr:MoaD/ThiS family protein [Thermoleophilia bacterium]NJD18484.1 hypothetical protein [Gemmatimonadota bacterium]